MLETLLHSLLESLKILPILFLAYVLIEFIEVKTSKTIEHSKLLNGKIAPVVGAAAGLVPECGFSAIASDLYTKKRISVGTLLAMYIATSDEAIPILLSQPSQYKNLLLILVIKFLLAILVGYGVNLFLKYVYKPKPEFIGYAKENNIQKTSITVEDKNIEHNYFVGDVVVEYQPKETHIGCCGHSIEDDAKKRTFWDFVYHPILHSLKIFGFVLIVNVVFGLLIYYIGSTTLNNALNSTKWLQPFIAALVGLIPNCAPSAIIANLFINGGLTLGACVSGLIANAGVGLAVLVKQNSNRKHTLYIISTLYVISVLTGLIITLI